MMLDYLERVEVFEREELRDPKRNSRHHGLRRKYTFRDIVVLRAIASLLDRGVSVHRIKQATAAFSRDEKFSCDRERVRHGATATQYFVTDGVDIFYADGSALVDVVKGGQGAFSFVVDLKQATKQVQDALSPEKRSRSGKN
jgi:DNA-binding transcriptional MerR regulator